MKPFYYLSEMNVSDRHGGGLTLLRILGEDLHRFDKFMLLFHKEKNLLTYDKINGKETSLIDYIPKFKRQPIPERFSLGHFYFNVRRLLNIPTPEYFDHQYYRKHFSQYLKSNYALKDANFLIVPQYKYSVFLANQLHKKHNINYVTWIMDDHVLGYNAGERKYYYPEVYRKEFEYHLKYAQHVFVISQNMADFYKEQFNVDSTVLFSPTDPDGQTAPFNSSRDEIKLCYFGSVWNWQRDALEALAENLARINGHLEVYTFHVQQTGLEKYSSVTFKDPVRSDEVIGKIREYDGVVLPYGFSDRLRPLSEFNISTKLSECLASGVPTVLVGPEYGAMTKFIEAKGGGAVIITDPYDADQINQIGQLKNENFRKNIVSQAFSIASKYTTVEVMRNNWKIGFNKLKQE